MKIVCIGRNYGAHAKELGNELPEEPVFFLKPEQALLSPGREFQIPEWSKNIHYEIELVFRISQECHRTEVKEIRSYLDGVTVGLDLTARDVQDELKRKGLPWEKAKAFDGSAVIGPSFQPLPDDPERISFVLLRNGKEVQSATASEMIFSPARLLSYVSRYITLTKGDLLFTGTPAGVGTLESGDHLQGFLDGRQMFELSVI
jgi:2-keto-4-pentenoate hydratase/2-oxohepta-3-ene-1,7-dioic acid hydratase in catechol pathway